MVVILDYGMGNLGSIFNMFKKIGCEVLISLNISDIETADKIIFPGVGSFDTGMKNLLEKKLVPILNTKILVEKIPILGICLGMQLMTKGSQEGNLAGLGWIDAETVEFKFTDEFKKLKVPHMGWNTVEQTRENVLLKGFNKAPRFYFAHSYHVMCNNINDVSGLATYGYDFTAVIQRGNIFGVQFHPEKSHKFGMQLLKNFADIPC